MLVTACSPLDFRSATWTRSIGNFHSVFMDSNTVLASLLGRQHGELLSARLSFRSATRTVTAFSPLYFRLATWTRSTGVPRRSPCSAATPRPRCCCARVCRRTAVPRLRRSTSSTTPRRCACACTSSSRTREGVWVITFFKFGVWRVCAGCASYRCWESELVSSVSVTDIREGKSMPVRREEVL